jgi:hypothetical protein
MDDDDDDVVVDGDDTDDTDRDASTETLTICVRFDKVGFGPVSWLIIAEIFPLELRTRAISLAVLTNFFWNMVRRLVLRL